MATDVEVQQEWLIAAQVAVMLDTTVERVVALARAGRLTVRHLPGARRKYLRTSVESLIREHTVEAKV